MPVSCDFTAADGRLRNAVRLIIDDAIVKVHGCSVANYFSSFPYYAH
jgi:hypothetical protein